MSGNLHPFPSPLQGSPARPGGGGVTMQPQTQNSQTHKLKMPIGSLDSLTTDRKNVDLVVLHMPKNSRFHGRVQFEKPGQDQVTVHQLFTNNYELVFKRTNEIKPVNIDVRTKSARVYQFQKIQRNQSTVTRRFDYGY